VAVEEFFAVPDKTLGSNELNVDLGSVHLARVIGIKRELVVFDEVQEVAVIKQL